MKSILHCLLLASVVTCGGCIPWRFAETAQFSGKVLDQATKQPVAKAKIYPTEFPNHVISTSADGYFDCPALHKWRAYFLIAVPDINREWHHYAFSIEAPGYKTIDDFMPGEKGEITNQVIFLNSAMSN